MELLLLPSKIRGDTRACLGSAHEHVPGSAPLQRFRVINNRSANQTSHTGMAHSAPAQPPDRNIARFRQVKQTSEFRIPGGGLSRRLCCKPQLAVSLVNSSASRLSVHSIDPLNAPCGSHEWVRKVLCFPSNLVVSELHDAHSVRRLAVVCQDEFGNPKITTANDSSNMKPLFAWLTSALVLYVVSTAGSLA